MTLITELTDRKRDFDFRKRGVYPMPVWEINKAHLVDITEIPQKKILIFSASLDAETLEMFRDPEHILALQQDKGWKIDT